MTRTQHHADVDVIVVGLGAIGTQALWRIADRGLRVVGLEQFTHGHDRGASHGESRIIRTAQAEGPDYVPLARSAWKLWAELEKISGLQLIRRVGGLIIEDDRKMIDESSLSADIHGLSYELLNARDLRSRFPQHIVGSDHASGFFESRAGLIEADRAIRASLSEARRLGAEVLPHSRVDEIIPDDSHPSVRCGDKVITARHVVVAAGAWLTKLVPSYSPPLRTVRRMTAWFAMNRPDMFTPERFPVFIRTDQSATRNWYGFPTLDGETIKIGVHLWPGADESIDLESGTRPPDRDDFDLFASIVGSSLRGILREPTRLKTCMYARSEDDHFVIGRSRRIPGLILLGGLSGHGFKFSPAIGEIAASLADDPHSPNPIPTFDPDRFQLSTPSA